MNQVISGVLLDIDGVLYVQNAPIEGAAETVSFLQKHRIPFLCISNTTRKSRASIAAKLQSFGISVSADHILTPAVAAASYLQSEGISDCLLLTTGDVEEDVTAAGITLENSDPAAVVVGDAGDDFSYQGLTHAFRALLDGAAYLALEHDSYWMDTDGLSLSAGPFVAALEYASGVPATVIGKPSPAFFRQALEALGTVPEETMMVGDDIRTDVKGAQDVGIIGVQVKTGKYRNGLAEELGIVPDESIASIADLPLLLK